MADTDANPMTDADITAAPDAQATAPLKTATIDHDGGTLGSKTADATQAIKDGAAKYGAQATDRLRTLADTGKARAGSALGQISTMIDDAAGQVDDRLGAQYGDYARSAASSLSAFSTQIENKNVDELLDDARDFVRKSPGVAIGIAAAIGFALARVVQSGLDTKS